MMYDGTQQGRGGLVQWGGTLGVQRGYARQAPPNRRCDPTGRRMDVNAQRIPIIGSTIGIVGPRRRRERPAQGQCLLHNRLQPPPAPPPLHGARLRAVAPTTEERV